jgi:hypothetical protein
MHDGTDQQLNDAKRQAEKKTEKNQKDVNVRYRST